MTDPTDAPHLTALHVERCRQLFLSERSRRETIRGSISPPVAAISFAVFAFSNLVLELDADRLREAPTLAIMALGLASIAALFVGLAKSPPRLLLVDEETAIVLALGGRQEVAASAAKARGRS